MKTIKEFRSEADLREVAEILKGEGIQCNTNDFALKVTNDFALKVHVSNYIKARDLIIEWANSK